MKKILLILIIISLFGCQQAEDISAEKQEPTQILEQEQIIEETVEEVKSEPELCCCKIGEKFETVMKDRCVQVYKSKCYDKIFCEQKEIKQVCCFFASGERKIIDLYTCMQKGVEWTDELEKCDHKETFEEVEAIYPDRPEEIPLLPADKVCCLVPMHAYHPYEKAFDTTVERCEQMKGKILPWEKCYEVVCCNRIGRLSLRKFMDCKTEMAEIEPMEKCKGLEPYPTI